MLYMMCCMFQLILPYHGDHYDALHLKLVGDLGQVLFLPYDLQDEESIHKSVQFMIGKQETSHLMMFM